MGNTGVCQAIIRRRPFRVSNINQMDEAKNITFDASFDLMRCASSVSRSEFYQILPLTVGKKSSSRIFSKVDSFSERHIAVGEDIPHDGSPSDLLIHAFLLQNGQEDEIDLKPPDPRPFIRSKRPSQTDGAACASVNEFILSCKAVTGKEIVDYEPGKWTSTTEKIKRSAVSTAFLISKLALDMQHTP